MRARKKPHDIVVHLSPSHSAIEIRPSHSKFRVMLIPCPFSFSLLSLPPSIPVVLFSSCLPCRLNHLSINPRKKSSSSDLPHHYLHPCRLASMPPTAVLCSASASTTILLPPTKTNHQSPAQTEGPSFVSISSPVVSVSSVLCHYIIYLLLYEKKPLPYEHEKLFGTYSSTDVISVNVMYKLAYI